MFYFCPFFCSTEDWTQGLMLASQVLYCLTHGPGSSWSWFFNRKSCLCPGCFGWRSSYLYFLCSCDDMFVVPHSLLLVEMGFCELFCPGRPQTTILLLISASQVAGITWSHLPYLFLSILSVQIYCIISYIIFLLSLNFRFICCFVSLSYLKLFISAFYFLFMISLT
jgi:hypothetical protein